LKIDFSTIAARYEAHSLVQTPAADLLLDLLEIGRADDVLDLGCGSGKPTRKIREITRGKVVGIDPSEGMIKEAVEKSRGLDISYEVRSAEELDCEAFFDVIFCNSAFQWFSYPEKALANCYRALRKGGKIGVQAPAKKVYSPNFVEAVQRVAEDPRTRDVFSHFKTPWFFLETEDAYRELFEKHGFRVLLAKIESVNTVHTPKEVFDIFSGAAVAGYLNRDCYNIKINAGYVETFGEIVKEAFVRQAGGQGKVNLVFNRLFLLAFKEKSS
jgi:trans-aconitate methyltransferase